MWYPQEEARYPVDSILAERLIGDLLEKGFDPAHSKFYNEDQGMSHSFGYIYHRIMVDKKWPVIPVSINTYYPPNQITPRRAYQLGRALHQAFQPQFARTDALQRRDAPHQAEVQAAVALRLFHHQHVGRTLDHAQQ